MNNITEIYIEFSLGGVGLFGSGAIRINFAILQIFSLEDVHVF